MLANFTDKEKNKEYAISDSASDIKLMSHVLSNFIFLKTFK